MRSRFIDDIQANGGVVVPLEKQADLLICDHARPNNPVGGTSWKYIEECIKAGELLDAFAFACGPASGTVRDVGSTVTAARGTRVPYTAEDDRILTEWVTRCVQGGGDERGNLIYKDLELQNKRHTWQSWRDHWIKVLSKQRPIQRTQHIDNTPPTPPSENEVVAEAPEPAEHSATTTSEPAPRNLPVSQKAKRLKAPAKSSTSRLSYRDPLHVFSAEGFHELFRVARQIKDMSVREARRSFVGWAEASDGDGTPEEWQALWDLYVLPVDEVIEAGSGRMMRYKENWVRWNAEHPGATADKWVEYWENVLKPLVEEIVSDSIETQAFDTEAAVEDDSNQPETGASATFDTPSRPLTEEAQISPTPNSHRKLFGRKSPTNSIQQPTPTKRALQESRKEQSSIEGTPDAKRRRTVPSSAIKASGLLNVAIRESPSKGKAPAQPIEILESNSSSSSDKEEGPFSPKPVFADLKVTAPESTNNQKDFEDEDGSIFVQDHDSPVYRPASPTLTFDDILPFSDDNTQFPNSSPPPIRRQSLNTLNTQAILDAETQFNQYDMPEPYLSDGDDWEYIDGPNEQAPKKQLEVVKVHEDASSKVAESAAFVKEPPLHVHFANLQKVGYHINDIHIAFKATSMDRKLAAVVLESLNKGRGIPENVRGIWTQKDDEDAEGGSGSLIRDLRKKHGDVGLSGYQGRLEFLRQYREKQPQ